MASNGNDTAIDVGVPTPLFALIDDMESTQFDDILTAAFLSPTLRKFGNWFYDSSTGPRRGDAMPVNITPARGSSTRARRISGSNLEDGMNLWAQLDHPTNGPVNLSAYAGISFWTRLAGGDQTLFVAVRDKDTAATQPQNDVFAGDLGGSPWFVQRVSVADRWQRVVLLFDDFRPGASVEVRPTRSLDTSAVTSIDFITGVAGRPFDLWIDDLALLCRGACPEPR